MDLQACRYTNSDTSANLLEVLDHAGEIGVRWALPGGLQRMEVLAKARNRLDMFARMNDHPGQRIALISPRMTRPISGWIYEVQPAGAGRVQYVCYGGWRRHEDIYDTTIYDPADTNGDVVSTVLTDHCTFYNGDSGDITLTGAAIGGWQPEDETGSTVQDIIRDMINLSDSNNAVWDYYLKDEVTDGTHIRQLIPYFKPRSASTSIDWQVKMQDFRHFEMSRGIAERKNDITIYYDTIGGTATGTDETTLTDSGTSFTTDNIKVGDTVINETDDSRARVVSVDSNTQITTSALSGGTDNTFQSGDVYRIILQDLQSVNVAASPKSPFNKEYREIKRGMDETQATYYANMVLDQYDVVKQQMPFVVAAPYIKDVKGARWPLLEVIARGGGYIRINDLYPTAALSSESLNNATAFFITALDYDHSYNQMRVNVDIRDSRLDVRLLQAGILSSEAVGRRTY